MIYTGTIYIIQTRMTITGPNDTIRIVWAQGEYFFDLFVFLHIYLLYSIDSFIDFKTKGLVVWVLGLDTPHHTDTTPPTTQTSTDCRVTTPPEGQEQGKVKTGARARDATCLEPLVCFFSFLKKLILIFVYIYSLDYYYHHLRRLQQQYRAQTTRIALFGPLVSFKIIIHCFSILITIVFRFSKVPNRRDQGLKTRMHLEPRYSVLPIVTTTTPPPRQHYHVITTPCHHHHPENTYMGWINIFYIFVFIFIFIYL